MSAARWFADRLGSTRIEGSLAKHAVPRRGFMFYLGGITLFLFVVQVASGILLTLYYQPDAAQAHASVERIVGEVAYGDLVHEVHVWAADLFVASLLLHVLTVMVRRSFRPPHNQLVERRRAAAPGRRPGVHRRGLAVEPAGLHRRARGERVRPLRSNHRRMAAPVHAGRRGRHLEHARACLRVPRGGASCGHDARRGGPPVLRVTPPGRSTALGERRCPPPTIPLYPDFFLRLAVAMTGVMVLILSLAIFVPRSLGVPANPRVTSPGAMPPWYLMPVHAIVRAAPRDLLGVDGPTFLVGAACVLGLVFVCFPFIDRRGSRFTAWLAWFVVLALILLSIRAIT